MCADAKMMRLLASELREAYANRRSDRSPGILGQRWTVILLPVACLVVASAIYVI